MDFHPGSGALVSLSGVGRSFGGRPALVDLDLHVEQGSIAVLLGPNGAGKTTAIRLLTGALPATSGDVRVFGLDPVVHGETVRRRCGVVSAKPALYERLTGRENLNFSAELYGLSLKTAPIEAAAERFGIAPALGDLVGGYSTGMKTRLALARAVLHDPDLLLLDEPTSGLDPESSVAVLDLVKGFATEGKTVLLCTHLLLEAEGLGDQIVIMHEGHCVEAGAPDVLMAKYWPDAEVHLKIEGVLDSVTFDGLPFVQSARSNDQGGYTVKLQNGDQISTLVAELCRRHVRITEVVAHRPTLEDLYFASRGVKRGEMSEVRTGAAVAPTTSTTRRRRKAA